MTTKQIYGYNLSDRESATLANANEIIVKDLEKLIDFKRAVYSLKTICTSDMEDGFVYWKFQEGTRLALLEIFEDGKVICIGDKLSIDEAFKELKRRLPNIMMLTKNGK